MTAETDGGVALGARFRAQAESRDGIPRQADFNGARFYATVGGFTLGVGNIVGAFEAMPGMYLETRTAGTGIDGAGFHSHVGNVDNRFFNWDAYESDGPGVNGIEVLYSSGEFSGHFSYSSRNGTPTALDRIDRIAANVSYTFGDWTAALGIQDSDIAGEDKVAVSLTGKIGRWDIGFAYADNKDAAGVGYDVDKVRVYGEVDVNAASSVLIWVANEDNPMPASTTNGTSYGIHYSYDLGGGASFEGGAVGTSADNTTVQAGVYVSF